MRINTAEMSSDRSEVMAGSVKRARVTEESTPPDIATTTADAASDLVAVELEETHLCRRAEDRHTRFQAKNVQPPPAESESTSLSFEFHIRQMATTDAKAV